MEIKGSVFNIEHYAVHDGPGIRTLVFLKGCPLRCLWCCNPESQSAKTELVMFKESCIGCGECVNVCTAGAIAPDEQKGLITDADKCVMCLECVKNCYANARRVYGRNMTVQEVLKELKKDMPFFKKSGGGITLSGGEPFKQHEFAAELLERCKSMGITTAAETCGHVPHEVFLNMLPLVDTFLFDLKHMDAEEHKRLTGVDNTLIHKNFDAIVSAGVRVIPRMPLIPTLNDSEENLRATCEFLKARGITEINLLPYHELGVNKYERTGKTYGLNIKMHTADEIAGKKHFVEQCGMSCAVY